MEPTRSRTWSFGPTPHPSAAACHLAAALAERLRTILPPPCQVDADGALLNLYRGPEWDSSADLAAVLDQESAAAAVWSFVDRVATICESALSSAQDLVAEVTAEPWPRLPFGGMAIPFTRSDRDAVHLWYGSDSSREEDAVIRLPPIALSELR